MSDRWEDQAYRSSADTYRWYIEQFRPAKFAVDLHPFDERDANAVRCAAKTLHRILIARIELICFPA